MGTAGKNLPVPICRGRLGDTTAATSLGTAEVLPSDAFVPPSASVLSKLVVSHAPAHYLSLLQTAISSTRMDGLL